MPYAEEIAAGTELGLHRDLDLARACADFYLSERMHADSTLVARVEVRPDGTRYVERYVKGFGSDSRVELRCIAAVQHFQTLTERLASEFARYLDLAIGGELRHAGRCIAADADDLDWSDACPDWCTQCRECHGEDSVECAHECGPDCCMYAHDDDDDHCCECEHECTEDSGCITLHEDVCSGGPTRYETDYTSTPALERLSDYLESVSCHGGTRSAGWRQWAAYREARGIDALADAARVFHDEPWIDGYGGDSWGTAADILVDYLSGNIGAAVFVDRCWTLQHNGGCIFDKFYSTDSIGRLSDVLEVQARRPYDELSEAASAYTRELWTDTVLRRARAS